MFPQKSILLVVPEHVGFPSIIKKNLEYIGFEVLLFTTTSADKFRYKSVSQRIHNFWRKTFLRDRNFKRKLIIEHTENDLLNKLHGIRIVDYALFIRMDLFPLEFVKLAKTKCTKLVGYQWDGLDRYAEIKQYIPLIDRFFVFDSKDLGVNSTLPTTNFYFDCLKPTPPVSKNAVYYIGSYFEERIDMIGDLNTKLATLNTNRNIKIASNRKRIIQLISSKGLTPMSDIETYEENLKNVFNANILIDIQNPVHKGLSFRIFEGIGYEKKVITTNPDIIHYDFYHPNNFLVWNGQSTQELASFIKLPYHVLEDNIKRKYSFTNWIAYMLDMPIDYIPISLPR